MEPKLSTVFKKIKTITIKILKKLWNNLLLLMIFFLVLDLIFGAIFFLNYYLLAKQEEAQFYMPLRVNEALIQNVSSGFRERENMFKAAEQKQYPDPFRATLSEETAPEQPE